jgi:hypothetical protein
MLTPQADDYASGVIRFWTDILHELEEDAHRDDDSVERLIQSAADAAVEVEKHVKELVKIGRERLRPVEAVKGDYTDEVTASGLRRDILLMLEEQDTLGSKHLARWTRNWLITKVRQVYGMLLAFDELRSRNYDRAIEYLELTPMDLGSRDNLILRIEEGNYRWVMSELQRLIRREWLSMNPKGRAPSYVRDALRYYTDMDLKGY